MCSFEFVLQHKLTSSDRFAHACFNSMGTFWLVDRTHRMLNILCADLLFIFSLSLHLARKFFPLISSVHRRTVAPLST